MLVSNYVIGNLSDLRDIFNIKIESFIKKNIQTLIILITGQGSIHTHLGKGKKLYLAEQ